MKHLQLMSFGLLLSAFCTFNAEARNDGPNDADSVAQGVQAAPAAQSTVGYGGGPSNNPYFISIDTANKMLESYLNSVHADIDGNTNLQSLIMDADAIREYLSNTSIKKVKVMFAHTLNYINTGNANVNCGYKSGQLTIILAGFDSDGNYIFAPVNKVPDGAIPCPTSCGVIGTASDMLLH